MASTSLDAEAEAWSLRQLQGSFRQLLGSVRKLGKLQGNRCRLQGSPRQRISRTSSCRKRSRRSTPPTNKKHRKGEPVKKSELEVTIGEAKKTKANYEVFTSRARSLKAAIDTLGVWSWAAHEMKGLDDVVKDLTNVMGPFAIDFMSSDVKDSDVIPARPQTSDPTTQTFDLSPYRPHAQDRRIYTLNLGP